MFVSIGLTTFDRKRLNEFCIWTIYGETKRSEYELIVVDNGSTDGTRKMLLDFKSEGLVDKLIFNPRNNLGSAINLAWDAADSRAVWHITLSNDSFCMEGWLENFKRVVASELKPDCVFCHMRMPDLESRVPRKTTNKGSYLETDEKTFYGAGLALRKEFVSKYRLKFLEGEKPWSTGKTSGSIYSHMARSLRKICSGSPVELGKPCILTQDCEYANPEYENYYERVFGYPGRGGSRRLYKPMNKFESLKLRGGHTRYPDRYYEGSDYRITKRYRDALNSLEGQAEWDRLEEIHTKA